MEILQAIASTETIMEALCEFIALKHSDTGTPLFRTCAEARAAMGTACGHCRFCGPMEWTRSLQCPRHPLVTLR